MPVLAIDLATREGRLWLVYASAICVLGALASQLASGSLLGGPDGQGQALFWSGAVAMAPLLLFGWRALPAAILLAAFVEFLARRDPALAALASLGDVGEGAAAVFAIRRFTPFDPRFRRQGDLLRFILVVVLAIPAVSAACGMATTWALGAGASIPHWFAWAASDATAILMTVPLALIWVTQSRDRAPHRAELAWLILAGLWLVLTTSWPSPQVMPAVEVLALIGLPIAFWTATHYGRRAATLAALLIAAALLGAAKFGILPFPDLSPAFRQPALIALLAVVLVGLLAVAIARSEQDRHQDRISESETRLRMLVESAKVVTYSMPGPDFVAYNFISDRVQTVFGYAKERWNTPRAWFEIMEPEDRMVMERITGQDLKPEQDYEWEYRLRHAHGHAVWVRDLFRVDRKADGSLELRGMMIDITALKTRELALEESQRLLEKAKSQAEAASRAKSSFLATISHELRTPMNAIIGFADVLLEGTAGDLNDKQREYAKDIADSGSHLLHLINDILDMSKIEAGKFELTEEVCDIGATVLAAARLVMQTAANGGITLTTEAALGGATLYGDPRAIRQIVLNLLSNAVKFTPAGGRVALTAEIAERGLLIAVSDTGCGMSEDTVHRLFQPFFQGSDRDVNKKREGTGLGLAISIRLAELHGGTIDLTSRVGQGTVATLVLPASRVQRPDAA
jgi:PAS domain S-box-containing protein